MAKIKVEKLREDLKEYYANKMETDTDEVMDVEALEAASPRELIELAKRAGLHMNKYLSH